MPVWAMAGAAALEVGVPALVASRSGVNKGRIVGINLWAAGVIGWFLVDPDGVGWLALYAWVGICGAYDIYLTGKMRKSQEAGAASTEEVVWEAGEGGFFVGLVRGLYRGGVALAGWSIVLVLVYAIGSYAINGSGGSSQEQGGGAAGSSGSRSFCSTHSCIPNFDNGNGYPVQCADGTWSDSGGIQGACSYHGGEY